MAVVILLGLPTLIIFVLSVTTYFDGVDAEKEHYDSRTEAVVISCVERTNKVKRSNEYGVESRDWMMEASYAVDGIEYITFQSGTKRPVGSTFTLSYNSENPSDCVWISDFDEYADWNKKMMIGSGAAILIAIFILLYQLKVRKRRNGRMNHQIIKGIFF
ncbi:MAG: DUF3592 domain-containing protein [Clostridia bacterium]